MGIETQTSTIEDDTRNEGNFEVEGEVDLEGLISALKELRKYKRKNKSLREQLLEYKEEQKPRENEVSKVIKASDQVINDLEIQLKETKRIEEVISKQFNEKQRDCEKLEVENFLLKKGT
jgi:hypothetical protein